MLLLRSFNILVGLICYSFISNAQLTSVSGTVYDITKKNPIGYVSVISTSGKGTFTDSTGRYSLVVRETDSIYFSYLNKATPKYPIKNIPNLAAFDISILRKVGELPMVTIKQRNYRQDSLQNRQDYADIFNYKKPGITPMISDGVAGMDFTAFIRMFQFKKNKRMVSFQRRLMKEEEDRFINHRFNKGLVKRLTGLSTPVIDSFMTEYKPTVQMIQTFNDLELGQYIIEAYNFYKAGIKINRSLLNKYGLNTEENY